MQLDDQVAARDEQAAALSEQAPYCVSEIRVHRASGLGIAIHGLPFPMLHSCELSVRPPASRAGGGRLCPRRRRISV